MFRLDERPRTAQEVGAAPEPAAGPWVEIATGGLPDKSGKYMIRLEGGYIAAAHFSTQHGKFNAFDDEESGKYAFDNVAHWAEIHSPGGVDWY